MLLEIVVAVIVIAAIMVMVGVPITSIITLLAIVLMGLVVLSMVLFALFFIITDIGLLFRRRVTGTFVRITEDDRFEHAVYLVDGTEYTCLFPAENIARRTLYHTDGSYRLLIPRSQRRKNAYDRHSLVVIAVGTVFSLLFIGLLIISAMYLPQYLI